MADTTNTSNTITKNTFLEVEYTGRTKDGLTFDTSSEAVAKKEQIFNPKQQYKAARICVGQGQILPGIDESLEGRKVGEKYQIEIPAEKAFGKRDVKKVQLVPMSTFKKHQVKPFPGLQVDFDGQIGVVMKISGGRVMVNFNHPLSGKDLNYEVEIKSKITDTKEQVNLFLTNLLQLKPEFTKVEIKEKTATIELPFPLPEQFTGALKEKLTETIEAIETVEFTVKELSPEQIQQMQAQKGQEHVHGPNCKH